MTACSISLPLETGGFGLYGSRLFQFTLKNRSPFLLLTRSPNLRWRRRRVRSRLQQDRCFPGSARKTLGPTKGAVSHFSASRRAMAKVRRMPRVRWNRSTCVQRV